MRNIEEQRKLNNHFLSMDEYLNNGPGAALTVLFNGHKQTTAIIGAMPK